MSVRNHPLAAIVVGVILLALVLVPIVLSDASEVEARAVVETDGGLPSSVVHTGESTHETGDIDRMGVSPAPAAAPAGSCSAPVTKKIRGMTTTLDSCYRHVFTHDGTEYDVIVYFTTVSQTTNTKWCQPANPSGPSAWRCDHVITSTTNAAGDNIRAVAMANEVERVMRFYLDKNLQFLPSGNNTLTVYIAEDPRAGWILDGSSIQADDDRLDNSDTIKKRVLAFHEIQHLVQHKYNSSVGWKWFYAEGLSRAVEDRHSSTDSNTRVWFIPEVNGILRSNSDRTSDITSISYRSVLWWTWLMDRYRTSSETEPEIGWEALLDFYTELKSESSQMTAVRDFIDAEGSSFAEDFIDYTLALYAYQYSPSDPRLGFLDDEINDPSVTNGLRNHNRVTGGPIFSTTSPSMTVRSSRYWEFNPANQCDFIGFSFDGRGSKYGFSVMTVDGGTLQDRWTSHSSEWSRTVYSQNLDRVVGVITAIDQSGQLDLGYGCVPTPTLTIKRPTSTAFELVGTTSNPRNFVARLDVEGAGGGAISGLTKDAFDVEVRKNGGSTWVPATIINSAYVQEDYWLVVQAPSSSDSSTIQNGEFYDLRVTLGNTSDTNNSSLLYADRTQDTVIVLDKSGSMSDDNKITAAKNAAALMVNELSDSDQGGLVVFSDTEKLVQSLQTLSTSRSSLESAIGDVGASGRTSIGAGMQRAAGDHDANGKADNMCSFVLLSDGYENEKPYWSDVVTDVVDNGCALHTVALGPEANEVLLQQIAGAGTEGSYDYADVGSNVPVAATGMGRLATATSTMSWENNLSRVYDHKATKIAGRQRLFDDVGTATTTAGAAATQQHAFYVDDAVDELVVSVAWQNGGQAAIPAQNITLTNPSGNTVNTGKRSSSRKTNVIWKVPNPSKGQWTIQVTDPNQEYYVSANGRTLKELRLFIGTPIQDRDKDVEVPIIAMFSQPGAPLTGARITATVTAPDQSQTVMQLFDDGNHSDGEANDGVYANLYPSTNLSEYNPSNQNPGENPPSEYNSRGSYVVHAVGVKGDLRREAQIGFGLQAPAQQTGSGDSDQDGMSDTWETANGLDPNDPNDQYEDPDTDGLTNFCEYQVRTNPRNSDTDGGGESDRSEVETYPECHLAGQDPHNPGDDRVGGLSGVTIDTGKNNNDQPIITIDIGDPTRGTFSGGFLLRRQYSPETGSWSDWEPAVEWVDTQHYTDTQVEDTVTYQYRVHARVAFNSTQSADQTDYAYARVAESRTATAKQDPFPPNGSVLINNGAPTTEERIVTLSLTADDSGKHQHVGEDVGDDTGTPVTDLEMRISTDPSFEGVPWQPFQDTVQFNLGDDVEFGSSVPVYLQLKDEAGNVSRTGTGLFASIKYTGHQMYLPIVAKQ